MDSSFHSSYFSIYSSSDLPNTNFVMSYVGAFTEVSLDLTASKLQRICKICSLNFKESLISKKSSKKVCKFCFEAVCISCSALKINSSTGDKRRRICISCLNTSTKNYFKRMTSSNLAINRLSQNLDDIQGNDSEYLGALKNLLDLKRFELDEKEKEVRILKQDWDKEEGEADNKEKRVFKLREELEKEENEERKMNLVLISGQEKSNEFKKEIERLKKVEADIEAGKKEVKVVNAGPRINLDVIRDQIFALNGLSNSYKHDIRNLKSQNKLDSPQSCINF